MALVVDTSVAAVVSATNVATTASFSAVANSLIVAMVTGDSVVNTPPTITMSDTASLSWTLAKRQNTGGTNVGGTAEFWYAKSAAGFTSKTVTATNSAPTGGSQATELRVVMFTGHDLTTPIGATAGATFNTLTTTHTTSITTTRANSWCWGKNLNYTRTATCTANGSSVILAQGNDGDGDQYVTLAHSSVTTQPTVSSGTLLTLGGTYAATASGQIALVEIMPAVGGAAVVPVQLPPRLTVPVMRASLF